MPRSVLVLTASMPPALAASLAQWDARVTSVAARTQPALSAALDAVAYDEVIIVDPDEVLASAIERSLVNHDTPVTLWFETDASWTGGAALDRPFTEDGVPEVPPGVERRRALHSWIHDERARCVFRATSQRAAFERVLGARCERATIAPAPCPPPEFEGSGDVVFSGAISLAWRHGADLLLRTVVELQREVSVVASTVNDAQLLEGRGLTKVEQLARGAIALVTARDGSALSHVEAALAAGALPVVAHHPAVEEVWPALTVAADPPVLAARVRELLDARTAQRVWSALQRTDPPLAPFTRSKVDRTKGDRPPRLTIGVPAYNASVHLARCVRSIARADDTGGLEIVVVNDGSTDDTAPLAARLAEEFPSVRVVDQENAGHGGAINAALREARGTWFRVIDADDFVDPLALRELLSALEHETCDLVLTNYSEVRPEAQTAEPVRILGRLPHGVATRFDSILDPLLGLTSWGTLLSTSTFRTEQLRQAGLRVTEHSAYVDLEYCTFGLEFVETVRHLELDLYRYSLGSTTQSVSAESFRKRYRQHEAVIVRLAEFARRRPGLSSIKRRYIFERVVAPVAEAHLRILVGLIEDKAAEKAFRARMREFPEVPLPASEPLRKLASRTLKAALPKTLVKELSSARKDGSRGVARELVRYVLPAAVSRFFER